MCLMWKEDKWKVTYWQDHKPTFDMFKSRDEVIDFIRDMKESNGGLSMNDVCIYPPMVDVPLNQLLIYGMPEFIIKEMEK